MIKYPSIDQFRNAIAAIHFITRKTLGKREANGVLIADQQRTWALPPVEFTGTVKLHGTNAAVVVGTDGSVSYQSRNRVLTPEDDNMGFAAWASQFEDQWRHAATGLPDGVCLFGEWIGEGIQHGVALSQLSRRFVIFEMMDASGKPYPFLGLPGWTRLIPDVHLITDFPTWKITVDIENPQFVQNELVEITMAVEAECPVGKAFGVSGVGEGVVWSADVHGERVRFKVKGEKHSTYRVKTLAPINVETVSTLNDFVANALTDARLSQGVDYLREQGLPVDLTSTGDFIRWVIGDVFKEDSDVVAESGLDPAAVRKKIGSVAATRYKSGVFQQAA